MRHNRKKIYLYRLLYFLLVVSFSITSFFLLESKLRPPLQEISHMQCKAITNSIIDQVTTKNMNLLETTSFLAQDGDNYTANTVLINHFCALLSKDITNDLNNLPAEYIKIPLGAVTGFQFLANAGPEIPFTLIPMGAVKADYDTAFSSVGINQINYKIWLNISIEMKIVNPLYQENILMRRKIMLADVVYGGKVPDHYFQISSPNEYLLTE